MIHPSPEMLDAYFEELAHADKEAERTWYKAGIAAYAYLCSPTSEQWKKEHGFIKD
jgi:hypothetical protein